MSKSLLIPEGCLPELPAARLVKLSSKRAKISAVADLLFSFAAAMT
jgi:hypothetical protein